MSQLVLLRHGQSEWNAENRFTGFVDVGLTDLGREEARKGGRALAGMRFDRAFSSTLRRAIETTEIALAESGSNEHLRRDGGWNITCHDDLRERDYGELAGLNKAETAEKFGAEQVHIWRRSYDVPPPPLDPADNPGAGDPRYASLDPAQLPLTECLKDTVARVLPYWHEVLSPAILAGRRVLVSAHGNSMRAMVKYLDGISDADITGLNIPNGVPLVYEFDDALKPVRHFYLGDADAIAAKAAAVAAQGRASAG